MEHSSFFLSNLLMMPPQCHTQTQTHWNQNVYEMTLMLYKFTEPFGACGNRGCRILNHKLYKTGVNSIILNFGVFVCYTVYNIQMQTPIMMHLGEPHSLKFTLNSMNAILTKWFSIYFYVVFYFSRFFPQIVRKAWINNQPTCRPI